MYRVYIIDYAGGPWEKDSTVYASYEVDGEDYLTLIDKNAMEVTFLQPCSFGDTHQLAVL